MRRNAKTIAMILTGCIALAGCGSKKEGGTAVPMNDMEVVDGTISDAMTDLDGVRSEGAVVALPTNRSEAKPAAAANSSAAAEAPAADTEIVSDQ